MDPKCEPKCEQTEALVKAVAPHEPTVANAIEQARAAGVPFLQILLALLNNQGVKAIVEAILALISGPKPTPAA